MFCDDAGERLEPCPECGQLCAEPKHFGPCDECREAMYGGREKHERVRLFTPAPTQIAGQQQLL